MKATEDAIVNLLANTSALSQQISNMVADNGV